MGNIGQIVVALYFITSLTFGFYTFVKPVKELLNSMDGPTIVTAMVCWKFGDKLKFTREFFNYNSLNNIKGNRDHQFAITDVTITKFPNPLEEHHHLIIIDLKCNETENFLRQVGWKLTYRFRWIALDTGHDRDSDNSNYNDNKDDDNARYDTVILKTFRQLPILPSSEIYCISRLKSTDFVIKQVYRISMDSDLILNVIRNSNYHGNGAGGLNYRQIESLVSRRRNLNGIVLRASLVITNPSTLDHLADYMEKHIDTLSKVNYFLTNYMIDYVNAKVNYSIVNSWGYMDSKTGKWTGMIGDLVYNRSDIGASALFFTSDRISFIDYIAMTTPSRSKFVFRSPKLSYTENIFLLPFHSVVWYSVFGLILATSLSLLLTTYMEWKLSLNEEKSVELDATILRPSIWDILLLVFGAGCQQGSYVAPRSLTSRILMIITFMALMFLFTSYSANIVALLQSPSNTIQTLEDLLNSRLNLGVDDTIFNRYYFSHATEYTRKRIYEEKILNKDGSDNFLSIENGVAKIREGLFAFHMETGVGYKIVGETFFENEKCGLQEIQYLQVIDPWYAIQKNSPYKEFLKVGMLRIREYGLQDRENSNLYTKKPKCHEVAGRNFVTASLIDTRPALLVLIWGFLISFLIFTIEILIHRKYLTFPLMIRVQMENAKEFKSRN